MKTAPPHRVIVKARCDPSHRCPGRALACGLGFVLNTSYLDGCHGAMTDGARTALGPLLVFLTFTLCPAFWLQRDLNPRGRPLGLSPAGWGRRGCRPLKVPLLRQGLHLPRPPSGNVRAGARPRQRAITQGVRVSV